MSVGNMMLDFVLARKTGFILGSHVADGAILDAHLSNGLSKALKVVQSAELDHAAFTDGGSALATKDIGVDIPASALVLGWHYAITEDLAVNGAAGETGFSLQLGDGSDVDRFDSATDPTETISSQSAGKWSVPILGTGGSGDGVLLCAAAVSTPTLTLTLTGGTPDATNFVHASGAGKFVVTVLYLDLAEAL